MLISLGFQWDMTNNHGDFMIAKLVEICKSSLGFIAPPAVAQACFSISAEMYVEKIVVQSNYTHYATMHIYIYIHTYM